MLYVGNSYEINYNAVNNSSLLFGEELKICSLKVGTNKETHGLLRGSFVFLILRLSSLQMFLFNKLFIRIIKEDQTHPILLGVVRRRPPRFLYIIYHKLYKYAIQFYPVQKFLSFLILFSVSVCTIWEKTGNGSCLLPVSIISSNPRICFLHSVFVTFNF